MPQNLGKDQILRLNEPRLRELKKLVACLLAGAETGPSLPSRPTAKNETPQPTMKDRCGINSTEAPPPVAINESAPSELNRPTISPACVDFTTYFLLCIMCAAALRPRLPSEITVAQLVEQLPWLTMEMVEIEEEGDDGTLIKKGISLLNFLVDGD